MRKKNKLLLFLENLPAAHALARACECQAFSHFQLKPPILDVGCGDGLFAKICFPKIKIDIGLDQNKNEIRMAKENNAYKKVVLADATKMPFRDSYFKTIISNSALEHIDRPDKVLAEANRVLKKGGSFIFTVPGPKTSDYFLLARFLKRVGLAPLAKTYAFARNKLWGQHLRHQEYWEKQIEINGFRIENFFSIAGSNIIGIIDFFVPLSLPAYLLKKIFKKWIIWRPKLMTKILFNVLNKLSLGKTEKGATFTFQVVKK
jgi:ubiquinone/menaquinone biosynthesis C-methylase UbiE